MYALTPTIVLALCCTSSQSLPGEGGVNLRNIAAAVEAYQRSIETLEFRTASRFLNDSPMELDDGELWSPKVVMYQEYGMESSKREYRRTLVSRGNGLVTIEEEDYRNGATAFSILRSNLDPTVVEEVCINRNFRDKTSGVRRAVEIRMGLVALDGEQLYQVFREPSSKLIGRRDVNGEACYVVESRCLGKRALYYLSPSHDLLACQVEHVDSGGEIDSLWKVESFRQVGSRWFPEKVVRSFSTTSQGRTVRRSCYTELEYIRVNERIPPERFEFVIPDSAKVIDVTSGVPRQFD